MTRNDALYSLQKQEGILERMPSAVIRIKESSLPEN